MGHRWPIIAIISVAALVRLLPSPFTGHNWDMYVWFKSGELFLSGNLNVYAVSELDGFPWGFYNYPPIWLYWLAASRLLANYLSLPVEGLVSLIKLPIIAADMAIGLLILRTAGFLGIRERERTYLAAAYLLNPVVIFISGIWGMFDSMAALFALLALYLTLRRRLALAGLSIGIGTAIKVFPALLLPVNILHIYYSLGMNARRVASKHLAAFTLPPLLASLPYYSYIRDYLAKLLFHTANIGQFTYWTLIATLLPSQLVSVFSWGLFGSFSAYMLYRFRGKIGEKYALTTLYAAMLAAFMATSPKVNVQYIIWIIPFMLLDLGRNWSWRGSKEVSLLTVNGAALTFIIATIPIIGYSLDGLGKINVLSMQESVLFGGLILTSAAIAGWRFFTLMLHYSGLGRVHYFISARWGIAALVMIFVLSVSLFPSPTGIRLNDASPRVLVTDSVDSLFTPLDLSPISQISENLASPTHIVIPLAPDFYNTYTQYRPNESIEKYLRFKLDTSGWTQGELRALLEGLKVQGYIVLAGIYIAPRQVFLSYGMQGYESEWLLKNHPYVVRGDRLEFNEQLVPDGEYVIERVRYADYLAGKVSLVLSDFGFDGVYILTEPRGISSKMDLELVEPLLRSLNGVIGDKQLFIDRVDPYLDEESLERVAELSDYVVLHTSPWIDGFNDPVRNNRTLEGYASRLEYLLSSLEEDTKRKLLYSVYVMDMTAGWVLPAIQVQLEAETFGSLMKSGYAIYYASRYLPYKLSVNSRPLIQRLA